MPSDWNVYVINVAWPLKDEKSLYCELNKLAIPNTIDKYYRKSKIMKFLDYYRPSILIVGHDIATIQSLYVNHANSMGVPTLLIQDGLYPSQTSNQRKSFQSNITKLVKGIKYYATLHRPFWQVSYYLLFELIYGRKWEEKRHGHGNCTMMAVFGNSVKDKLVSEGISPNRIRVTGNPKFDELYKVKLTNRQKKPEFTFQDKKVVLLLSQYFVEEGIWTEKERNEYITLIVNTVGRFENCQLVIKLHPTMDKIENYVTVVNHLSNPPIICQFEPLPELLDRCDVAVTVSSTSGLEAMALGKPLIIFDPFKTQGTEIFHNSGAFYAQNSNELSQALNQILDENINFKKAKKTMESFVYYQASSQDGMASQRIIKLIEEMIYGK